MLTPDTVLQGRYLIVRQLGQGGMGAVYEAIDQRLDTTVALKETLFSDEKLRKQFEREARLLARLHHPALPRVSDHFSEGEGQFLVMQFIPGEDLAEMMNQKRGPFPSDQVLTWADQLLDALDYLHTQDPQIVHRDIKPQNLKLTPRGQIILLDFGLAKGQAGDISRVTTSASIFGYTPNYAPLEQIQGLGTDSRSDLYSLGATAYHLMTGVKPPDALTRAAAFVNGQPDPLLPASTANPAVGSEVDLMLGKAMAQSREQRYASAAEMRKALHGTEQASTVINRGEAQTVLFPPPGAATVAASTQAVEKQRTIKAGETTVVRNLIPASRKRATPILVSAIALLVVAGGVLGIYLMQKTEVAQVHVTPSPSPSESLPISSPSVAAVENPTPNSTQTETKSSAPQSTPVQKKTERTQKTQEEPKQTATPEPAPTPPQTNQDHEPPTTTNPRMPRGPVIIDGPRPNRNPQGTRVTPSGAVIRNLPDGSQIITMPDGTRVYRAPDGKTKVLPSGRPNRKPPTSP
jgi:eukaryotic-like serine/threonine-protein kinase